MIVHSRIDTDTLRDRLDASYYTPEVLENEAQLRARGATALRNLIDTDASNYGVLPPSEDYLPSGNGVPLIRGGDLDGGAIHDPEVDAPISFKSARGSANVGDVLILIKGALIDSPAGVALVSERHAGSVFNGSCYRVRVSGSCDAGYLVAYCQTRQLLLQKKREIANTGIAYNAEDSILGYLVPATALEAQRYVGDKVRQADRLRERARTASRAGTELVEGLVEQRASVSELIAAYQRQDSAAELAQRVIERRPHLASNTSLSRRFSRVTSMTMTPDRMDSSYYAPRFLENEHVLASCGTEMVPIASLTDKCNCGSTPVDVEYDGRGLGLIRTTDVRPNSFFGHQVLRTSELRVGSTSNVAALSEDLVYTMSGTIGYAAVIPPNDEVFSFSNTIVRARFSERSGQDPWFTAAFFNSKYGYSQSLRLVSGGIQGHVMPNPFKKLLVPAPDKRAQRYIGDQFRQADACANHARALVWAAKLLVEQLIVGRIGEADLVAAQKALEAGDRSADREILKGLRPSDAPDAKPLITDVDALYALLDGSDGQDA